MKSITTEVLIPRSLSPIQLCIFFDDWFDPIEPRCVIGCAAYPGL